MIISITIPVATIKNFENSGLTVFIVNAKIEPIIPIPIIRNNILKSKNI